MSNLLAAVSRTALQGAVLAGAGSLVLGTVLYPPAALLVGAGAFAAYRQRQAQISANYGSARWATAADIQAAGLRGRRLGVPLGYAAGAGRVSFGHTLHN